MARGKTRVNYPNGISMALSYDNAGRETGIVGKNSGGTVLTSYTYSYINPATNKLTDQRYSMTDTTGNVTKYSYDASNQLTTAGVFDSTNTQTGNYAYTYDANGNRLTAQNTLNGPTTTYSYNVANELTSSSLSGTTMSYSYDGNGNQTASSAGLSVNYNVANQATTMNGTTNTYSGADQSQRVKSGATTAVYTQLELASEATAGGTTYYIHIPRFRYNKTGAFFRTDPLYRKKNLCCVASYISKYPREILKRGGFMFWQYFIWNKVTAKQRNTALIITLVIFIGSLLCIFKSSSENYALDYMLVFFEAYTFFSLFLFFTAFRQHLHEGRLHWHQDREFWLGIFYCAILLMCICMNFYDNRLIALLTMIVLLFLCIIVAFISNIFLILTFRHWYDSEQK